MFLWRYNVSSLENFLLLLYINVRKRNQKRMKSGIQFDKLIQIHESFLILRTEEKVSFFSTRKKKREKVVKFNFVLSNWKLQEFSHIPHTVREIPFSSFLLPPLEMHAKKWGKTFLTFIKTKKGWKSFTFHE